VSSSLFLLVSFSTVAGVSLRDQQRSGVCSCTDTTILDILWLSPL